LLRAHDGRFIADDQQHGFRLGDNNLPRTATSLAADAFFTKSGATARRTLLGLGNWQVSFWNQGVEYTSETPQSKQKLKACSLFQKLAQNDACQRPFPVQKT